MTETKVRWSRKRKVARGYGFRFFIARHVVAAVIARLRWSTLAWSAVAIAIAAGLLHEIWGTPDVHNVTVEWVGTIGSILFAFLGVFGLPSIVPNRTWRFRPGATERAAIANDVYIVTNGGKNLGFQLAAVRRVRRVMGIAAVQMKERGWAFVPVDLFPDADDWDKVERWLARTAENARMTSVQTGDPQGVTDTPPA